MHYAETRDNTAAYVSLSVIVPHLTSVVCSFSSPPLFLYILSLCFVTCCPLQQLYYVELQRMFFGPKLTQKL